MVTQAEALELVRDRLNRLSPIERDLAVNSPNAGPGYCRWLEGSAKALADVGLRREADRLFHNGQGSILFNDNVEQARATLESLLEQIRSDPATLGFWLKSEPAGAIVGIHRRIARVRWPWIPAVAIASFVCGLYGRAPLAVLAAWVVQRYHSGAARASALLAWIVSALTPGPPLALPAWIGPAAFFFVLVGLLTVGVGLLVELIADELRRDGPSGLWRSRPTRWKLLAAVALAAVLAALAAE